MSLRFRLTLFYTIFLGLVLVAVGTSVYAFTQRSLVSTLEERSEQAMSEFKGRDVLSEGVQTLSSDAYYLLSIYFGSDLDSWESLRSSATFSPRDLITQTAGRLNVHENPTPDDLFALIDDKTYQTIFEEGSAFVRLTPKNSPPLIGYVTRGTVLRGTINFPALSIIAYPLPTDTLKSLGNLLLRTIVIAFALFAIGVWLLSQRVLLPVKRVTTAAAQVSSLDLSQRVPEPKTNDEIKELAVTLNKMLERLQESFETQRRFTADASHELRTPVTAIVGHANYLLRRTHPTPEQIDSLTVIRREAERMAKLVNDLLELARADAGFTVEKHPINLLDVVESVHMEVAPVAGNTNIHISSAQPLVEVFGDAARLKQVVLNLVQNAINAGSKNITISLIKEKQKVRLEILDDGPGIPGDAIPHLFDRFFRVDGARSTRGNGSGLGLAIVRWIVQQHDGSVSVESKLGEGTVFTVILPTLNPKQTEVRALPATNVTSTRVFE